MSLTARRHQPARRTRAQTPITAGARIASTCSANFVHSSTHPGADAPSSESFVSKSMKPWPLAVAATAAFLACGPAAAQFKSADDAIEYRQGALLVMDHHFGSIGAMVDGKAPFDAKAARANADLVVTLARLPWGAFVEGSDKGDTNARLEVWAQPDKFKAAAQRLQDASVKLAAAAATGKPGDLKAAFSATAEACKACHDDFRKKH